MGELGDVWNGEYFFMSDDYEVVPVEDHSRLRPSESPTRYFGRNDTAPRHGRGRIFDPSGGRDPEWDCGSPLC